MKQKHTQINRIRKLALALAQRTAEAGSIMVCFRTSEAPMLPLTELLYDRCAWCDADIYYDRQMPSPPDLKRICIECYAVLQAAEKRGAN
jgi:hypothetical protein